MAYQSLYRRYRPQKFSEIRGQQHIVAALKNAVAKGEVGHAYMFHGPRGTGKTTSARVLAKALNCTNLGDDSEPCGECESCVAIEEGRSFDLHELDAASNNRVDDMRDLLAKVNLGTPGNVKVYILDEVHMLTSGAENALLKTLEEPPDHVIWVLATTEPHKVVQTIRSRCQVFELGLLGAEEMADHVRWIIQDAALDVDEAAVDYVVAAGGGSARDTLSALDRVVAAGGVVEIDESTDRLLSALADRDATVALASVGDALGRGKDPRTIGEGVLAGLRDAFLTAMGSPPPRLTPTESVRADDLAGRMTPAAMTRALELLGTALVEMRQAPDPRVDLEVALVRLCRADADRSIDSLVERIDQLEARLAGGAAPTAAPAPTVAPAAPPPAPPAPTQPAPTAPSMPPPAPAAVADDSATLPPPPSIAPAAEPESAPSKADGPAAAARAALAEKLGRPAPPIEPVTVDAEPTPPPPPIAVVPDPAPTPVDTGHASAGEPLDTEPLMALRPESPREVVGLADQHLGVDKDTVVARANELLGPAEGGRSTEELTFLWQSLVDEFAVGDAPPPPPPIAAVPDPVPAPPSVAPDPAGEMAPYSDPGPEPDPEPVPDPGPEPEADPDDIDLHDLVDAPAHTEQFIEKVTEAFPGAELHVPQEPTE
jgi:DNA polymerase-3 subunit gamma/tau